MVKVDMEEAEEGMLRRMRVNARICCFGTKAADLKIYLFSATKQDRAGPSPAHCQVYKKKSLIHKML